MADLQSVVELIFNGIDNASETTRAVSNSLSGLADTGKNITSHSQTQQPVYLNLNLEC